MKRNSPPPDEGAAAAVSRPTLLLVGEGPHDIGREDGPGGALVGFVHAALSGGGPPVEADGMAFGVGGIVYWTRIVRQLPPLPGRRKTYEQLLKGTTDRDRVRAAMLIASFRRLDGVVVLRDCETVRNLSLPGNLTLGEYLRGARLDYAAAEPEGQPALVVAAPSRCHETWLLADRDAVRQILADEGAYHFSGDHEERPPCDTLKAHQEKWADERHVEEHEVRRGLSFLARPEELGRCCPRCYPAFLADVDRELRERFDLPPLPGAKPGGGPRRRRRR